MDTQQFKTSAPSSRTVVVLLILFAAITGWGHPGRLVVEFIWLQAGEVDFGGMGYLDPAFDPGSVVGPADRFYVNGYARVDSSGNNGGLTWFWGLDDDQGISPQSIDLYVYQSGADKALQMEGDPESPGIGLKYIKPIRIKDDSELQLVVAARLAEFKFLDATVLSGLAQVLIDSYNTDGIVLPQVPYAGGYQGPGPLIDSDPFRRRVEISPYSSETSGLRHLSGDLMALRLGLSFERELNEQTFLSLQVGYEALRIDGTFRFAETTTLSANGHSGSVSGVRSRSVTDAGAYINGAITRNLTERLTLEVSLGFSDHDPFSIEEGRHHVTWDLSELMDLGIGLGYRF
jgi:hypothetical protein